MAFTRLHLQADTLPQICHGRMMFIPAESPAGGYRKLSIQMNLSLPPTARKTIPSTSPESVGQILLTQTSSGQIAHRIQQMMSATRQLPDGRVEWDWPTMEAGVKLFLEFTKGEIPVPPTPKIPEARAKVETSATILTKRQLPQSMESPEELKRFLTPIRPMLPNAKPDASEGWAQGYRDKPSTRPTNYVAETSISAGRHTGQIHVKPVVYLITAFAVISGVFYTAVNPIRSSNEAEATSAPQMKIEGLDAINAPSPGNQSSDAKLEQAAPPDGWKSRADYDAWSPKFDASLSIDSSNPLDITTSP